MKKAIPVIIAIALILVIVGVSFGNKIYEKYSYGQDRADLYEYYEIYDANQVPIVLQDERLSYSATLIDGGIYLDKDTLDEYFTTRFYLDENEGLVLYTMANGVVTAELGSDTVDKFGETLSYSYPATLVQDDTLYVLIDYVKEFVNMSYAVYEEPLRVVAYTEWGEKTVADIKDDTQVRWKGGVKSEILTDVTAGTTVEILEPMDDWTKVKTDDGFIGYVENKRLTDQRTETETPVTDVNEEFTYLLKDGKINMSWHNMEYPQGGSDLKAITANTKSLNVISPTWFYLTDDDGNLKSLADQSYVTTAHDMGMEVWALVANFHSGYDVSTYEVLSYTSKRNKLEDALIEQVLNYGADGINVDFENMDSTETPHFVQFIRELGLKCHENNLVLSVDNYVPSEYTAHYNRREQAKFADYIVIMGYDEYYKGSATAGSVSSIPWMQEGIKDTAEIVGADRVINAVPFYTRIWKTTGGEVDSEAVDMQVAKDFIKKNSIETTWDESTYQNYGEKEIGSTLYQVWLEDTDSLSVRINIMEQENLAGIASWCLGQETSDVWDLIAGYMAN